MKHAKGPWTWKDNVGAGIEIFGDVQACEFVDLPRGLSNEVKIFHMTAPAHLQIACERWLQFEPQGWHEMQIANAELLVQAPTLQKKLTVAMKALEEIIEACDPNGKVHSEHQSKYASIISEEALVKIKQLK